MARVKFGAIATEIRGSMGGTTFQKNRYGFTIKNKQQACLSSSVDQNLYRVFFSQLKNEWSNLTNEQKTLYNAFSVEFPQYPKNSTDHAYSGYDLFRAYNLIRLQAGISPLVSFITYMVGFVSFQPTLVLDGASLYFTPVFVPGLVHQIGFYYISNKLNADPVANAKTFRRIPVEAETVVTTDIATWWLNSYGALPSHHDILTIGYALYDAGRPILGQVLYQSVEVTVP